MAEGLPKRVAARQRSGARRPATSAAAFRARLPEGAPRSVVDKAVFLREWLGNPLKTGAVSPSGRWLARAMANEVDVRAEGPVVELGPGTGVVTEALLKHGVAEERLVLVEFNPDFCRMLAKRFPKAKIIQGDAFVLDKHLGQHAIDGPAAIVTSLPLLLKPLDRRVNFVEHCLATGRPGMPIIQFSYGAGAPVPPGLGTYSVRRARRVWLNLPPATVWVYSRL